MRYQLVPETESERRGLAAHPSAQALFDPLLPVIQARAIMAAARCGVFEALADRPLPAPTLAAALSLGSDTLHLLLRLLAAAGYVTADGSRWRLTRLAKQAALASSPTGFTAWIALNYLHWRAIDKLEEVLATDRGIDLHRLMRDEADWVAYQGAMLETARPAAPLVAVEVPVSPAARRMLDIGGGHGLYGAEICRRHPPMTSEVLELPAALACARRLARQLGVSDLVTHRAGNALTADLGSRRYDLVFLGNITHHFSAEENRNLLARIQAALRHGGTVAIWDFHQPDAGSPPDVVVDGFALLFRINSGGRVHALGDYSEWMARAGFRDVRRHRVPSGSHVLLSGRVPPRS
jgi:hypothetical protein